MMNEKPYINWAKKQLGKVVAIVKEEYGDQSSVYKLYADSNYFLKIGKTLAKEHERLNWLQGKLLVPTVIGFTNIGGRDALLMSAIEGRNLATLTQEWQPEKIVDKLVSALQQCHAVSTKNCPFGTYEEKTVLVHGDACLPNIISQENNTYGYVDLGDATVASPEVDFAAAIWSLQHNLGPG